MEPIYVTRPFLPPLDDYVELLQQIWNTRVLTNNGPFHQRLESRLAETLDSHYVSLTNNGMMALELALAAADLGDGEVITTPYSFVATTHALALAGLEPVFVDVRPDDLNIDAAQIEAAITSRTRAIMAVHVYGNPCNTDDIAAIAARHDLTVIYDAAHAFGVRYRGRSLLSYGDFAAVSFHATKAFNTFEGGAVVSRTAEGRDRVNSRRNFGIAGETEIPDIGTNAKMSEINAAMGLLQLDHFESVRQARERIDRRYRDAFGSCDGLRIIDKPAQVDSNYSYFPVLVGAGFRIDRNDLYEELKTRGIYSRRYFYPLLSSLPMYAGLASASPRHLPVAVQAAAEVLCLPIYPGLSADEQEKIIAAVLGPQGKHTFGDEYKNGKS